MNTRAAELPRSASVISPTLDVLCVGGLSILVFVPLLLAGVDDLTTVVSLPLVFFGQMVFNYAHFMASYRIVYRDRDMILRHKWATIGVPLILLAAIALAFVEGRGESGLVLITFVAVSSGYLAWHYTGQAWGMMVSFAHLKGVRFDRTEYWLIRGGLRILLCWHLAWFLKTTLRNPENFLIVYQIATAATAVAALMGAAGLVRMWNRTGQAPPFKSIVAWVAIFVWYAAIARWGIAGLFFVQLAHSIQYLEFPWRVELNRASRGTARSPGSHMLVYAGLLLLVTLLVTFIVPGLPMEMAAKTLGIPVAGLLPVLISHTIGIHHFFTDGVVWKLRDPEVQTDLFAHARPVAATTPIPPMWWERRFWQRGLRRPS